MLGEADNWLQRIGAHNVSMIKHLAVKMCDDTPGKTLRLATEIAEAYLRDLRRW